MERMLYTTISTSLYGNFQLFHSSYLSSTDTTCCLRYFFIWPSGLLSKTSSDRLNAKCRSDCRLQKIKMQCTAERIDKQDFCGMNCHQTIRMFQAVFGIFFYFSSVNKIWTKSRNVSRLPFDWYNSRQLTMSSVLSLASVFFVESVTIWKNHSLFACMHGRTVDRKKTEKFAQMF